MRGGKAKSPRETHAEAGAPELEAEALEKKKREWEAGWVSL